MKEIGVGVLFLAMLIGGSWAAGKIVGGMHAHDETVLKQRRSK